MEAIGNDPKQVHIHFLPVTCLQVMEDMEAGICGDNIRISYWYCIQQACIFDIDPRTDKETKAIGYFQTGCCIWPHMGIDIRPSREFGTVHESHQNPISVQIANPSICRISGRILWTDVRNDLCLSTHE